jgi:hypothetical protein
MLFQKKDTVQTAKSDSGQTVSTENHIRVHKHFETDKITQTADIHSENVVQNLFNVDRILERVYSSIEDKLQRQRLKKGYW